MRKICSLVKWMAILAILLSVSSTGLALTDEGKPEIFVPAPFAPPLAAPPGTTDSLTTLFAANNSFAGNTFDVEVTQPVTILGFEVNLDPPGTTTTVSIYYRDGTAVGAESSSDGWTLLGTDINVQPQGLNAPTEVNIGGLTLQPGQVYGFYVDVESYPSASLQYTNGGPTPFTDGIMTITTQHGKGNPAFSGANFFPRQWNGTIHYSTAVVGEIPIPIPTLSPLALVLMAVGLGVAGIVARCRLRT